MIRQFADFVFPFILIIQLASYQTAWAKTHSQKDFIFLEPPFSSHLSGLAGSQRKIENVGEMKELLSDLKHPFLLESLEKEFSAVPNDTKLDLNVMWTQSGVKVDNFFLNLQQMTISYKGKDLDINLREFDVATLVEQIKQVLVKDRTKSSSFFYNFLDVFLPQAAADQIDIIKEGATVLGTGLGTTIVSSAASGAAAATLAAPALIIGGLVVALAGMSWMIYGFVASPEQGCVDVFDEFSQKLEKTKMTCHKDSELALNSHQPLASFDTYHLIDSLVSAKNSPLTRAYAQDRVGGCLEVVSDTFSYWRLRGKKSCIKQDQAREVCKEIALTNSCLDNFLKLKPKTINNSQRGPDKFLSPTVPNESPNNSGEASAR